MDLSDNFPHSSKTDSVKRNLKFSFHESTPVIKSRKRKSFIDSRTFDSPQNSDTSYDTCISDSYDSDYRSLSQINKSCSYDFTFDINHVMVSSPLDKNNETIGLSSSLEKCSLLDFGSSKRIKYDNQSPSGKRKSSSAPGTPNYSGKTDPRSTFQSRLLNKSLV